jgi:hypothetical protein
MIALRRAVVVTTIIASAAGCGSDGGSTDSTTSVSTSPAAAASAMCLEALLRVDGTFFFGDPYTDASGAAVEGWPVLGQVDGGIPCNDTSDAPSPEVAGRIVSARPLVGATVWSVPGDPDIVVVDEPGGRYVYRDGHSDPNAFDVAVREIRVSRYDMSADGTETIDAAHITISDGGEVSRLVEALRAAEYADTSRADNDFDHLVVLVRDDGLRVSILVDSVAGYLPNRRLPPEWTELLSTPG